MTANRLTVLPLSLLLGATLLCGCMPATKTAPDTQPVAASPDKVAAYRESVQKLKPGSIVGLVMASQAEENLAAVGDVPVKEFKVGQTLSFVDVDGNSIGAGQIRNITNDLLIVKYDLQSKRPPQKGDLALWQK